jgi:hypothetical protein
MPRLPRSIAAVGQLLGATALRAADLLPKFSTIVLAAIVDRTEEGRRRAARRLRRYVIAATIVLIVPLGFFGWLWEWALHAISFPSAAEMTSERVIAIEAADGRYSQKARYNCRQWRSRTCRPP